MTVEELRLLLAQYDPKSRKVTDEQLLWFICVQEARMIFDSGTVKELAGLFQEGIKARSSLEDVQEWLNIFFDEEDEDEIQSLKDMLVDDMIKPFYGI